MMVESNYIPSPLQFSASKLFFQNQNTLLQKVGFFSPASIDIHYKYTFQQVNSEYFIQGGEFEGLTIDHNVQEKGIVYKIGFLHPKFQNVQCISADITKNQSFENTSVGSMIKSFPIWQRVVFLILLSLLIPFRAVKWLFRLNLIGACVLLLFSVWKVLKLFYKLIFQTKTIDFGGFATNYQNGEDVLFLNPDVVKTLNRLNDFQITKFCYTGNCLYLLQSVYAPKENSKHLIRNLIFSDRTYTEQEKAELQQRTMTLLNQSDFLSTFMSK